MKLLLITPYFYPKLGGLEKYAYDFSIALKKYFKWNIVVITSNHKNNSNEIIYKNGMKIYRLAPLFTFSNTPINPLWYWKIKKIINVEQPDCINAHTPVPFMADMAGLAASKIPFLVTYHAFSLYKHNFTIFNFIIKLYKIFEYLLFRKANKIILVSDALKESIPAKFRNKIFIINNSLSLQDIPRYNNHMSKKTQNIVFISSLDKTHEWKGLDEILHAIKIYTTKMNNKIILNVIGDGDSKRYYQHLANKYGITKQVKFLGKKHGREKYKILKDSSIGIIYPKSSNDAFPTVMLEYWAYSLAIIASDIMPINKIIKNKKTGYLIKPKNPKKLANAINLLLSNKNKTNEIGYSGYQELTKKYVLENEIKKFQTLTGSIII
ncbi:MAG TPA: glycosyltransferase family 4 protein [Candidatus Sulfotelmatobacter sp.]|jgi:glycosyltransferase involved in cell wall biosynthesis|nr:glycosyltransferase family 4 protein [Candidatus Sulfotelmatobacter sp.]